MSVIEPQPAAELGNLAPNDHIDTSKRCHLLELPAELRVRIYEYLYDSAHTVDLYIFRQGNVIRREDSDTTTTQRQLTCNLPSLLKTCKLISREANPVLYRSLVFSVSIDAAPYRNFWQFVDLGRVGDCLFFRNVQRIRLFIRLRSYTMSLRTSEYLDSIWGNRATLAAKTLVIVKVSVFSHEHAGDAVDGVYATLATLSYRPGAKWYCSQDSSGRPRFVSEHAWKDFEQKTGVLRYVRAAGGK
ncbi:hypothetical protein LTR56_009333 [Elasticomyces elasticus]|nr:hypothetical protein LTR56_009333 [Elasticomyces elasticus]KAK3666353.1 hypothetical protein LTR22_002657 [Elasticomyces elasticus]KAK4917732.1 hypothetical protein LTR49_014409 [Elasticomyces elasticus]KAK5766293.1 hypothetical protein LTS12_003504 [Elasticomyces elasticus]